MPLQGWYAMHADAKFPVFPQMVWFETWQKELGLARLLPGQTGLDQVHRVEEGRRPFKDLYKVMWQFLVCFQVRGAPEEGQVHTSSSHPPLPPKTYGKPF